MMRMPKDRVDPEVEKKKARQQTYETVIMFVMVCGLIKSRKFVLFLETLILMIYLTLKRYLTDSISTKK